jgi:uncharacterized membrane protein YfcA
MSPTPSGKPRARPAAPRLRVLRLGAIAMAAGAFSGLFGVGGGTGARRGRRVRGPPAEVTSLVAIVLMSQPLLAWQLAKKAGLR